MLEQNYKENRGLSDYDIKKSRTKDTLFSCILYFLSQSEEIIFCLKLIVHYKVSKNKTYLQIGASKLVELCKC